MPKVLCIFGVVLVCLHTFTVVETNPTSRKISSSLQQRLKRNLTILAREFDLKQELTDSPKRSTLKSQRFKNRSTVSFNSGLDLTLVTALPTNTRTVMMFSKNKYFLQISNDGSVNGTQNGRSPNVRFELQLVRVGIVRIKSIATGMYLAMDKHGKLRGRLRPSLETLFETLEVANYHWYRSYKYKTSYVGIRKDGKPKPGHQTAMDQKAVLFFPI